ncbi:MAG: ribonuclease [Burkholderiales bacterium]|jgi:ribonuclease R|nr:ribonuclease [Burkholderiales bacterium]
MNKKNLRTHHCIYHKNKNGMGGVAVDKETHARIFIADNVEKFALDNDEVTVRVLSDKDEFMQGEIIHIEKHNTTNLVGFVQAHKPKHLLRVNNPKFGHYLVVINTPIKSINRDELLNAVITSYPSEEKPFFEVALASTVGKRDEDHAFIEELIIEAGIPVEFTKAAWQQAEKLPDHVLSSEMVKHEDLRHVPFVTIDGEDAKDFDDAVFCENKEGIFHLYVAIADVSHYVTPDSALDHDAYLRGTSIYYPKRVIPMLPENLSNGLCSLKPNVDRLTVCAHMEITPDGDIVHYKIFNAVIHSHARLTYGQVQEWINDLSITPSDLISNISNLYLAYKALLSSREKRGAIDFDTVEPIFNFDAIGNVEAIVPRTRLEAHRLIEECMLAANVTVADFLARHHHQTLFRIHEKPNLEKFTALKDHLNSLAIKFDVKYEQLTPRDYTNLLHQVREHEDFQAIQNSVLRSMQLAIYSPHNVGHFGLSYKQYLHFTSPIRRYPDLLVHRAVKSVINNSEYHYTQPLALMGEHTSFTERRAEESSRKVDTFYKCQYAKKHIGNQYDGVISSVANFGLFIYIPELLIDGLVHVTDLGSDYFIFNEKSLSLVGKSSGFTYAPGQKVQIEIESVNMAKLFINLKIVL